MSHISLFDALLDLISSSVRVLQHELEKASLPEPWLDLPQLHPWDIETPSKQYWDARRTLLSSLGTMTALVQNPRERILCEGMGYHKPAVQNFVAHTRIADILSGPDVDEAVGLHVDVIARKTNTHPAKLERILRFLCIHHIFQETSPNVFANNRCSTCFKSGSPNADVPFYWSDISFRAATAFSRNLRDPKTALSERVQDAAFSAVFGSIKPELGDETDTREIGDLKTMGGHLDRPFDSTVNSDHQRLESRCCDEIESDFERVPSYLEPPSLVNSSMELPSVASHLQVLSDFGDDSSDQLSPLSELTGFRLTSDSGVSVSVRAASSSHFNGFDIHDHNISTHSDTESDFHKKFHISESEGSITESDCSELEPDDVNDSGVVLLDTKDKRTATQEDCANLKLAQTYETSFMIDDIKTVQERSELDVHIPSTTMTAATREPDELASTIEPTTAFSFLSYPQCGLYRKAFAQGMFTLEIMNGALGYRDINWKQWDKEDNVFVELGASTGHMSLSILPCLDHARFINQDLPEVCQEGIKFFSEKDPAALQSGRVVFQPHDFFTAQPVKGAAVYVLSNILHDWPNKEALDILGNIAEAMTAESRLLICEIVHVPALSQSLKPPTSESVKEIRSENKESDCEAGLGFFNEAPWPLLKDYGIVNRYSHHQTIELMVLFNGLDRTLAEYCDLFDQRNLELVKIHPIRKLVSVMELKLRDVWP